MDNKTSLISQNRFGVLSPIKINNYTYQIKDKLANQIYSYRCVNRFCKIILHIDYENLIAHNNSNLYHIKVHKTINFHLNDCINKFENEQNLINNNSLIKKLIENNIFKEFSHQKNLLASNNIYMADNKLKYEIEVIKNTNYLTDIEYINNYFTFKGNLNENEKKEISFCISKQEYFNYKTNEI